MPSKASISPMTRLVANSAAIAVPDRPATMRAVNRGPSSRTIAMTINEPISSVAPIRPSSRTACEMTRKLRMPESTTISGIA